jgi:hypothetical protein
MMKDKEVTASSIVVFNKYFENIIVTLHKTEIFRVSAKRQFLLEIEAKCRQDNEQKLKAL